MTLLQRDRENIELGREEGAKQGAKLGAKIIKRYNQGMNNEDIASSLELDLEYVNETIANYEND